MLELQKFIKENRNWEELLAAAPYSLSIKRKDTRILFKYSQINSDFSLEIVREARGLILEDKTWKVICYPFKKFFNFGEEYADNIDWESAVVETKEDGSLIKIYFYNDEWKVGTNSTIDAEDAELQSGPYKNFRQLFDAAAKKCHFDFSKLNRYFTYCCEICSEFNTIVCPQSEMRLIHIGTRNNRTFQEVETEIGIPHPQRYALSSLDECIEAAKKFDFTKEGFVIVDHNYNRLKCKSPAYVAAHRMLNNGNLNLERAIELIRTNEIEEFLNYFPVYKDFVEEVKDKLEHLKQSLSHVRVHFAEVVSKCSSRAKYAQEGKTVYKGFLLPFWFALYDNPTLDEEEWLNKMNTKKLAKFYLDFYS